MGVGEHCERSATDAAMMPSAVASSERRNVRPHKLRCRAQTLPILPKVVDNIGRWLLFDRNGEKLYAVGSIAVDRYLIISENMIDVAMRVISYLDGSHDLLWIQEQVALEWDKTVDVAALCQKLLNSGLIATAEPQKETPYSEVLRHSVRLFTFQVRSLFLRIRFLQTLLSQYGVIVGALLILIAAIERANRVNAVPRNLGALRGAEYLWLWLGVLVLALVHEGFHGLAGLRYGLVPKSITFALYLGFIPYVYIRIPGIYTIPPIRRVLVWLAGMYANILIGALLILGEPYIAMHQVAADISARLALANAGIFIFNLSPFMATDMYFILSTLSKTPNSRTASYEHLKKWIAGERGNGGRLVTVYLVLSLATIAYCAIRFLAWLYALGRFALQSHDVLAILHQATLLLTILTVLAVRAVWGYVQRRHEEAAQLGIR